MSDKFPETPQTEEVDIMQLFNAIGKLFERFFNFLGNIFKGIYLIILRVLIYIKNNFLKMAIPIAVGLCIGVIADYLRDKTYASSMVVQPNFNSNVQLYNNIAYLNELTRNQDSLKLSKALNISPELAGDLAGFSIEAVLDDNTKLRFYNDFIKDLDSAIISGDKLDFEEFINNMPEMYFDKHRIEISSADSNFPIEIQSSIVQMVDDNLHFDRTKKTIATNIEVSKRSLEKQLQDVDTLRGIYNKVLLFEAQNKEVPAGGTNITLSEQQQKTNELSLFSEARSINQLITELNEKKASLESTVTVLSNLNPIGEEKFRLSESYTFRLGLLLGIITVLFFCLLELNRFLDRQNTLLKNRK